jgi:hypothetical protein
LQGGFEPPPLAIALRLSSQFPAGGKADKAGPRKAGDAGEGPTCSPAVGEDTLETIFRGADQDPLDGDLVAALGTAALEHVLAVGRLHANTEAVRGAAFAVVGLVGALHSYPPVRV